MEIVYSTFIGIIVCMIASMIAGIGLQCRRDNATESEDTELQRGRKIKRKKVHPVSADPNFFDPT